MTRTYPLGIYLHFFGHSFPVILHAPVVVFFDRASEDCFLCKIVLCKWKLRACIYGVVKIQVWNLCPSTYFLKLEKHNALRVMVVWIFILTGNSSKENGPLSSVHLRLHPGWKINILPLQGCVCAMRGFPALWIFIYIRERKERKKPTFLPLP